MACTCLRPVHACASGCSGDDRISFVTLPINHCHGAGFLCYNIWFDATLGKRVIPICADDFSYYFKNIFRQEGQRFECQNTWASWVWNTGLSRFLPHKCVSTVLQWIQWKSWDRPFVLFSLRSVAQDTNVIFKIVKFSGRVSGGNAKNTNAD